MEKIITYFGQLAKVGCDENCNKAWGHQNRPKVKFNKDDPDDFAYKSDDELGAAPKNPKTYENGEGKPINKEGIPNRWCVRECERCAMSEIGKHEEPLQLTDFSQRVYNMPWFHQKEIDDAAK